MPNSPVKRQLSKLANTLELQKLKVYESINPKTHFGRKLFEDAGFAELWNVEHPDNATCVKS